MCPEHGLYSHLMSRRHRKTTYDCVRLLYSLTVTRINTGVAVRQFVHVRVVKQFDAKPWED